MNLTADKTIRAWETATFKGTINTNGFKLTVIAGNSVNMNNVANLPPNIDISIGLPTECQGTVAPQSPSQLYAFCGKTGVKKYNPIAPIVQPLVSKAEYNKLIGEGKFTVSPNPFSNQVIVDFNLEEETLTTLDLSNALGQTIRSLNLVVSNINNVGLKLLYFPTFYLKNYPTLLISRTT